MRTDRASTRPRLLPSRNLRAALLTLAIPALVVLAVASMTSVSPASIAGVLASGRPEWLLASAALYALGHVVSALVWRESVVAAGMGSLPVTQVMRAHWLSRGASEFLPAQLGEVARVAALRERPECRGRLLRVVGSIGAFKLVDGLFSLLVALVIVAAIAAPLLPGAEFAVLGAMAIVGLAAAGFAVWRTRERFLPARARTALEELAAGVGLLRGEHPVAPAVGLQSLATTLRILSLAALLPAYGAPVSAAPVLFALLVLTGLLPISPGGAGVREAAVVPVLIVSHGMGLEAALAVSFATQAVGMLVSLAGAGLALAVSGRPAHPDPAPAVSSEPAPQPA